MNFITFSLQVSSNSAEYEFVCASVCVSVLICLCVCVYVYNHRLSLLTKVRCCMQNNFTKTNEGMTQIHAHLTTVWLRVLHFKFFF